MNAVARRVARGHSARRWAGWLLELLADAPVPTLGAERFAAAFPDGSHVDASPLVEEGIARPASIGPLSGDVVIKDQIDVAGFRTGIGRAEPGDIIDRDATLVARISAAGGRVIGKSKMTELGIDGIGMVMHYAMPTNPRAPGYSPGGSSTGTAVAVASGLARYGVGGDGLGSIRIPAAFCGLVGLKPSRERIPRDGIRSPVRSLDAVGPIARTAADCAALWQVMVDEPVTSLTAWIPERIGIGYHHLRPTRVVAAACDRVLAALGAPTEIVDLPGLVNATFLGGMIGAYEMTTGPYADAPRSKAGRTSQMLGRAMDEATAQRLYDRRDRLRRSTRAVLDRVPILAFPTTAIPPPAITRKLLDGGAPIPLLRSLGAYTPLANLCDLPAIAVPAGVDDRGRPLSIMFVSARGGELSLLRLAHAVEATGLGARPV